MDIIATAASDNALFAKSDGSDGNAAVSTVPPKVVAGIKNALVTFGEGCVASDIEAAISAVSEDFAMDDATEVLDKAGLRADLTERLVYGTDFATGYVMDNLVITLDGETASAKPFVLERVSGKNVWFEFELREEFGAWVITGLYVTSGVE